MLSNAGISKSFSAKTLVYACDLVDMFPSSAVRGKTSLEVWSEKVGQEKLLRIMVRYEYLSV